MVSDEKRRGVCGCACVARGALGAWLWPVWGGVLMGTASLACTALACLVAGGER